MITYIKGTLIDKKPTTAIVEVNGIGFEIFIPVSSYDRLPETGKQCTLLTYEYIREDARLLYGFVTEKERNMFKKLMEVSGIGPKLALSILSGLSVREIILAIVEGNIKQLSQISGIGRKTAERITVELKDRLDESEILESKAQESVTTMEASKARDAVMALIALGYKEVNARRMVAEIFAKRENLQLTIEEIVKLALSSSE